MSLKFLVAGLMLCLNIHTLSASDSLVTGTVVDDAGRPIEFATVTIFSLNDTTLIGGVITGDNGKFALNKADSPCMLRISALGFEPAKIENPSDSLGIITLHPAAIQLGEVEIKGKKPATRLKSDGLQAAISGTYLSHEGTALDLLGKMPFVTKNGTQLEVLGKGIPTVYVNGKEVRDKSELEQLSSSVIKNVDVITSPGARYPSTVNAVILITTIKPTGDGFSFNDRTTIGYKRYAYLFEQMNFNYRRNKLDVFGMINYENYRERPRTQTSDIKYFQSDVIRQTYIDEVVAKYPVYQGKTGLNYFSDNKSFGVQYDFSFRPADITSISSTRRTINDISNENLNSNDAITRYNRQHLLNAYYTDRWGDIKISFNIDGMWQLNNSDNSEVETSSTNPMRDFATANSVYNRLIAGNFIASIPLLKGEVRFGTEISDISRRDSYISDADYITSANSKIKETTSAIFAESDQTFGKISITAGIRWEHTDSRYYTSDKKQRDQSRSYENIAPSFSISTTLSDFSMRLACMRKISRPIFGQLSSAVRYIDRYSYETGNPNLKPIYRDYLSLTGSWNDFVIELNYCSTDNYFMWQTSPHPSVQNATLLKMENMPRFSSFDANLYYSPCFFEIWRPSLMASIMSQNFKIIHNGNEMKLNRPLGSFRLNNAIHLPGDIWLNIDMSARTNGNADNLHIKSDWHCDLGLYKAFAHDTWSIKIQFNDVFDTARQELVSFDAVSVTKAHKIYDTREITATIRYNFNAARSRYNGQGAANAEKNRL